MNNLRAIAERAHGEVRGNQALIPGPGHSPRDRSLSLALGDRGQVLWHSFAGDTWASVGPYLASLGVVQGRGGAQEEINAEREKRREAKELELGEKRAIARALWRAAQPIAGSLAEIYLKTRGIDSVPDGADLRFHPTAPFTPYAPDYRRWPTMVGAITAADGEIIGAHLTFLKRDGSGKAPIDPSRKVIGSQKGGAIRLGKTQATVVVAEGVETALSAAARCGASAVAAISAGNLACFEPAEGVDGVLIAFDRDPNGVGQRDARKLMSRLNRKGVGAMLLEPPAGFSDWNEADQERRP